jgi:hypothetical protein
VGLVHEGVEFLSTALFAALTDTTHRFWREEHFVTRYTRRLVAANPSRDRIAHAITRPTEGATAHTSKKFLPCTAATVTKLRDCTRIGHERTTGHIHFTALGILILLLKLAEDALHTLKITKTPGRSSNSESRVTSGVQ